MGKNKIKKLMENKLIKEFKNNHIYQESLTSEGLASSLDEWTAVFNYIKIVKSDKNSISFEMPSLFSAEKTKKKLWGLFKGVKIEEKDIEEAKKSLFPENEF